MKFWIAPPGVACCSRTLCISWDPRRTRSPTLRATSAGREARCSALGAIRRECRQDHMARVQGRFREPHDRPRARFRRSENGRPRGRAKGKRRGGIHDRISAVTSFARVPKRAWLMAKASAAMSSTLTSRKPLPEQFIGKHRGPAADVDNAGIVRDSACLDHRQRRFRRATKPAHLIGRLGCVDGLPMFFPIDLRLS